MAQTAPEWPATGAVLTHLSPPLAVIPQMVGRSAELVRLTNAVLNPPAIVVVEGEHGIGKTRLIQELVDHPRLRAKTVLVGRCQPVTQAFPLGGVVEALRLLTARPLRRPLDPVAGALRGLLPELEAKLPPSPEPLDDPGGHRHRLLRGIREILDAAGSTLLVIEDLHWADDATLDFLPVLMAALPARLSLVVTYRRDDVSGSRLFAVLGRRPPSAAAIRIQLEPLDAEHVGALAASRLGLEHVPRPVARQLCDRTGGVPFAVEELVGLLDGTIDVSRAPLRVLEDTIRSLAVPAAVQDAVGERVARLDPGAASVVDAAAVWGIAIERSTLASLCGLDDLQAQAAVDAALAVSLLVDEGEGRMRFRHEIMREAVYARLTTSARQDLHRKAAAQLESLPHPPAGQLAVHYQGAGDSAGFTRWAEAAANACVVAGDDAGACRLLSDALDIASMPEHLTIRLALRLGEAALHALEHDKAIPILSRAVATLRDETRRGELQLALGLLYVQQGHRDAAVVQLTDAVAHLETQPDLATRALASLAYVAQRVPEQLRWARRAVEMSTRAEDPAMKVLAQVDHATVLLVAGDVRAWDALRRLPERAETAGELRQLIRGRLNVGSRLFALGHYEAAGRCAEEGLRLSTAHGYERNLIPLQTLRLLTDWATGAWSGLLEAARSLGTETHGGTDTDDPARVEADLVWGLLLLAQGQRPAAERILEQVVRVAQEAGELTVLAHASAGVAMSRLWRHDAEGALAGITSPLGEIFREHAWVAGGELVTAAVQVLEASGHRQQAADVVSAAGNAVRGKTAPAAAAGLVTARAVLAQADGRFDVAAAAHRRAARRWQELGRPYEVARSLERAGLCMAQCGAGRATVLLVAAADTFARLGASWDANRVRRELRGLGVAPAPASRPQSGPGQGLSSRELEVAELVAGGKTDREIAEMLFISVRTASNHVANILRKLGVQSRREVVLHE